MNKAAKLTVNQTTQATSAPVQVDLPQAKALKQTLVDFVLDAEDELATALESFSATQLARMQQTDLHRRDLVIDRFVVEGKVGVQTPIDLFIAAEPDLSESDQLLLQRWRRGFIGLFEITQAQVDQPDPDLPMPQFELRNWTTAKHYWVQLDNSELQASARLKAGDIILAQIVPIQGDLNDDCWMFFGPWISLGRLGKPKLAVAIGNFKQSYKDHLYSDAPELLAEAWTSVENYHQQFTDFFGSNEVTLSGYELGKKLTEFQEVMLQKQLAAAGIDQSKSIQELADEAGISEDEIAEVTAALGEAGLETDLGEAKAVPIAVGQPTAQQTKSGAAKMMAPKVELPAHLKKAEQVTVLTHPRWGQVFLTHYAQFEQALLQPEAETLQPLVKKYLEDPEIPVFVWHHLAQKHPAQVEAALTATLDRPIELAQLDQLLAEFGKSLETELPEIASVPIHLHTLFQEAVLEVSRDKSKKKPKAKTGFQR